MAPEQASAQTPSIGTSFDVYVYYRPIGVPCQSVNFSTQGNTTTQININQGNSPNDLSYDGHNWELLASSVTPDANHKIVTQLSATNSACGSGYINADALLLVDNLGNHFIVDNTQGTAYGPNWFTENQSTNYNNNAHVINQSNATSGANNYFEWSFEALDTDNDGVIDSDDDDDDNDGISDMAEGTSDFDGDGLPNHLDLDSDGDGCPDALEGSLALSYAQLATGAMVSGPYNSTGESINSTQGLGSSQDANTLSAECDPCNPGSSSFSDMDGDGVGDLCDIDNDNDGITDEAEGLCETVSSTMIYSTSTDTIIQIDPITGVENVYTLLPQGINGNGLAYNYDKGGLIYAHRTSVAESPTAPADTIVVYDPATGLWTDLGIISGVNFNSGSGEYYDGVLYLGDYGDDIYKINLSPDGKTMTSYSLFSEHPFGVNDRNWGDIAIGRGCDGRIGMYLSSMGNLSYLDLETATDSGNVARFVANVPHGQIAFVGEKLYTNNYGLVHEINLCDGSLTQYPISFSSLPHDLAGVALTCAEVADADSDGIPNYLDTDSDGDGCPDATEGSAGLVQTDVDANGVIVGAVDANGLPSLLNGTSQTTGTSLDSSTLSLHCAMECIDTLSCWDGYTDFYQIQNGNTIIKLNPNQGNYTSVASISGATSIDAVDMYSNNNKVFGIALINGQYELAILYTDGTVMSTGLTTGAMTGASISPDGIMYLIDASGDLSWIDLESSSLSIISTGQSMVGVSDISYVPSTGLVMGIRDDGTLISYNPSTSLVTTETITGAIQNDLGAYSALWVSQDSSLFAYNSTSGKIYSISTSDFASSQVNTSTSNIVDNDGFNNKTLAPVMESSCSDGIDNDGDGLIDCDDGDCDLAPTCITEICDNGIDDDGDGLVDCADGECFTNTTNCVEICDNGIDDNGNGLIDGDDIQCTPSESVNAGLESNNSLSDKIAQRNYRRAVATDDKYIKKKKGEKNFQAIRSVESGIHISEFIPEYIGGYSAMDGTPDDLVDITSAIEVASADYYLEGKSIGGIIGLKTQNKVYEHSKFICDRLGGSLLSDVSYLSIGTGNIIKYSILLPSGQKEVATSLSFYLDIDSSWVIQNHWNIHKYPEDEEYLNIQMWAHSDEQLIKMVDAVKALISSKAPIRKIESSNAPRTFVSNAFYEKGKLHLNIRNKSRLNQVTLKGGLRNKENGVLEDFNQIIPLHNQKEVTVEVETGFIYDIGFEINDQKFTNDELFISDGTWLLDADRNGVRVDHFDILSQEMDTSILTEDCLLLERAIDLEADVMSYANVSRSLTAKYSPLDVSAYEFLAFDLSGVGDLEVTIVKSSIQNWNDQYRIRMSMDAANSSKYIALSDFKSKKIGTALEADDVQMVVFSIVGNGVDMTPKKIHLNNLRFTHTAPENISSQLSSVQIYPNPTEDIVHVRSPKTIQSYRIVDAKSSILMQEETHAADLTINVSSLQTGIYLIQLIHDDQSQEMIKFQKK